MGSAGIGAPGFQCSRTVEVNFSSCNSHCKNFLKTESSVEFILTLRVRTCRGAFENFSQANFAFEVLRTSGAHFEKMVFHNSLEKAAFIVSIPHAGLTTSRSTFVRPIRPASQALKLSLPRRQRILKSCSSGPNVELSSASEDSTGSSGQKEEKKVTKTQKIAAMLGQSRESMQESASRVKEAARMSNIKKYGMLTGTIIVSVSLFVLQKMNPNAELNVLKFMMANSDPPSIVGTNELPSVIDFGATWCTNCKAMAPRIFDVENMFAGRVNFVTVDSDDPKNADLLEQYEVDGIPQISFVDKNGKVKGNLIGIISKSVLSQDIDALLDDKPLPYPGLSIEQLRIAQSEGGDGQL